MISLPGVHGQSGQASKVELFLWFLFVVLSPFYFFQSGAAQPADVVLVLFVVTRFLRGRFFVVKELANIGMVVVMLLVWMACVNLAWFAFTHEFGFLKYTVYCSFNLLAVVAFCSLQQGEREQFIRITATGMVFMGLFLAVYVAMTNGLRRFDTSNADRQVAFFNNPNQLAFYSILSGTFVAIINRFRLMPSLPSKFVPLLFLGFIYLTLMTASRAGIVSIALAAFLGFATRIQHLVVGGILLVVLVFAGLLDDESVQSGFRKLQRRIDRGNKVSLMEQVLGRGFDRIQGNEQYLIFGAGEGFDDRFFAKGRRVKEFHSTFGALIFSYGVIAVILMVTLGIRLWRTAGISSLFLLPPLLFGVTHNGVRQIEFWLTPILLVMVMLVSKEAGKVPVVWQLRRPVNGHVPPHLRR